MIRALSPFTLPHLSDEAVAAYADGVLPPGPHARARHHLSECAECTAAVRDQQSARRLLQMAAAPAAPGSLLERLRQLPASAPITGTGPGALTLDGQPVFAAYHVTTTAAGRPAPVARTAPEPAQPTSTSRRLHLPVFGVTAAAAATLIVGVLAGTASTAGGGSAQPTGPASSVPTAPVNAGGGVPVNFLNLTGTR